MLSDAGVIQYCFNIKEPYCSCQVFSDSTTAMNMLKPFCEHLLAIKVSIELGKCEERIVTAVELRNMVKSSLVYPSDG